MLGAADRNVLPLVFPCAKGVIVDIIHKDVDEIPQVFLKARNMDNGHDCVMDIDMGELTLFHSHV